MKWGAELNEGMVLSNQQVFISSFLLVGNAILSLLLRLKIAKTLMVAAVRCAVQLFLVGIILQWIFIQKQLSIILIMSVIMTTIAGLTAYGRTQKHFPGMLLNSLVAIFTSSWLTLLFNIFLVIRPDPWYHPQYFIPFLGMILGNSLTGVSLGLDRFNYEMSTKRHQIELTLALGGKKLEAALPCIQEALRMGLIPITNTLMVVGLVSLPGMMTGQMIVGANPIQAVKYQIVIMFMVTGSTGLGIFIVTYLGFKRLFNSKHQFLFSLIEEKSQSASKKKTKVSSKANVNAKAKNTNVNI